MPKIQMNAEDHQSTATKTIELPDSGEIDRGVIAVEGSGALDFAATEAFMNEKVEVVVAESVDPNAENPIPINVNGTNQFIFRGVPQAIKRKYIEVLARCKHTDVRTQVIQNPSEDPRNLVHKRSALKYPFQILRDDNPRGPAWLKNILAEQV